METRICSETGIGYTIAGKGKTILLLHGFGEDHNIWLKLSETLSNDFQILMPDLTGTGLSASLPHLNYSIEDHATTIRKMLGNAGVEQVIVMGHSMGGYVSLAFAGSNPGYTRGLGLLHSTSFADDAAKKEIRQKTIRFLNSNHPKTYLQTAVPGLFHTPELHADSIRDLIDKGAQTPAETLGAYQRMMMERNDNSELLKQIDFPVLMIAGKHDLAVPFHQSLKQSHFASITDFHILKNSAHMGMLEERETFHQAVIRHLLNFHGN